MHALFVGVDAGGSHTIAALARGDELLRTIAGPAANPNLIGIGAAAETLERCIARVLEGESPAAIAVGVAGAGDESIAAHLRAALTRSFPNARIVLCHDARIALRAALPEGDGLVLIAGTGSIAYAEIGDETSRAGGYGYLLGDKGSGYAVGAAALRHLLTETELGSGENAMLAELAAHLGANDRPRILARIYQSATPVADIAACAPLVLRHAARGEQLSVGIVEHAAQSLFELIARITLRHPKPALPVVFSGGLLRQGNALTQQLEQRIAGASLDVRVLAARVEPCIGALHEARRLMATS
ncbi:MAG TPA: BadF/BadG/BcrA/BcrD ATPase family protein [Candidatus Cybelea sp.]|nr:BadF/BadG/BcrA/BcrD ATPase family protein [Candidatus Cybelea sp.]